VRVCPRRDVNKRYFFVVGLCKGFFHAEEMKHLHVSYVVHKLLNVPCAFPIGSVKITFGKLSSKHPVVCDCCYNDIDHLVKFSATEVPGGHKRANWKFKILEFVMGGHNGNKFRSKYKRHHNNACVGDRSSSLFGTCYTRKSSSHCMEVFGSRLSNEYPYSISAGRESGDSAGKGLIK
jgi:hypothetical protein